MATALEEMKAACRMSDEEIKEREAVLFELANFQPLPRPTRALPYRLAVAIAAALGFGILLGAGAMAWVLL